MDCGLKLIKKNIVSILLKIPSMQQKFNISATIWFSEKVLHSFFLLKYTRSSPSSHYFIKTKQKVAKQPTKSVTVFDSPCIQTSKLNTLVSSLVVLHVGQKYLGGKLLCIGNLFCILLKLSTLIFFCFVQIQIISGLFTRILIKNKRIIILPLISQS